VIDQIITGIAIKLGQLFPTATVYVEPIEQDMQTPAFYVHCIDADSRDNFGIHRQNLPFEIVYFPLNGSADIYATLQDLLLNAGLITLQNGETLRGTKLNGQPIDDVLHFFVNYDVNLKIVMAPVDVMEEIKITGGIENG